ncbi:hypothetical protein KCMC57_up49100 [Kitasatospora sp. CMC57]|uniref:Outer membrane channel protein CpnT-like N-terminal domain-containing protein n=1 Tax=Kitasatospora sp. CMC57 TaxID=3231513 RepID=A0AB33JZ36_9ACTN
MKQELPPELEDVLKTLHSSEEGGDVQFPDGNEERINDLAAAWKTFNDVADVRIRTIWAHAKRACEHMSGEAADSYERYLEKYGVGEGSHAGTILTAGKMVEAHLRGAAAAITDTKTTMINQLEYAKKYIEQNPAGKKDDIAKSEGVKSAVEAYHTYVKDVTGSVDTMLKAGADHGAATDAATQIANLAGGKVPPPAGPTPPGTKIDSAPPPGAGGGGAGGGGEGGGGAGSGSGGGGGGAGGHGGPKPYTPPKVQPYKPPATKNPYLGGGGAGLGPDGKPLFKSAVQPPGLNLAGHSGYLGLGDGAALTPYSGAGGGGAGGGAGGGMGGGSAFGGGVPGAGAYGRTGGLAGAGGAGARAGAAGGGRGGMAGGAAGAGAGRGTAGAPGAGAMGGAGGGKGGGAGGGNRFLRPTRLGAEEKKRRRDRGIVGGEQIDHEAGDPHFERMRRQWLDEARGGSTSEAADAAAAAAAAQPAVGGGGDLMAQLAGALLGTEPAAVEAATSADSPEAPTGSVVAQDGTAVAPAAPAPEEEYLDRARSVAERRGRPDEEGAVTEAPPAVVEPTPIRQEGGYDVPSPFLRAALTRIAAGAGAGEGGGTPRP